MAEKPRKREEIISIEEDEVLPDSYGLERFMEEVNILELEGFYFCPNRKAASKKSGVKSLGELADRPVTIDLSGYGQPGDLSVATGPHDVAVRAGQAKGVAAGQVCGRELVRHRRASVRAGASTSRSSWKSAR